MKDYDYLIVGAGLWGSTFAYLATRIGKRCLVIDKRNHIGGNCYTEEVNGIYVHKYGPHIFHTSNNKVWNFVNQFVEFNRYVNSPIANYNDELYNLPFNMNTFTKMFDDVKTPDDVLHKIKQEATEITNEPRNLEEQAISLVGRTIYEKLIKGYTEKQWGCNCDELPANIIKRLPVRLTFDNNYFNDTYQGIPINGYNELFDELLCDCDVRLNCDYFENRDDYDSLAQTVVYTGAIDEYYKYCYGHLDYRSLRFDTQLLHIPNLQGVAVMNYTDSKTPYTRIIEHKHFNQFNDDVYKNDCTIVTKEYPVKYDGNDERYYPINNEKNNKIYQQYKQLADKETNVIFGGRLGKYTYFDMDDTIEDVFKTFEKINKIV